jgi:hypothetical protein
MQAFSSRKTAMSGTPRWKRGPWNTDTEHVVSMNTRKHHFALCRSRTWKSMEWTAQFLPGSRINILV